MVPTIFPLVESLLSLGRLSSRGKMGEVSMEYLGDKLRIRCVSEGTSTYYVGVLVSSASSDKEIMNNTFTTLAS